MEGAAGIAPLVLARQRIDESESSESNESQAERTGLHPIVVPDNAKVMYGSLKLRNIWKLMRRNKHCCHTRSNGLLETLLATSQIRILLAQRCDTGKDS